MKIWQSASATVAASILRRGMASGYLVAKSMNVRTYLFPCFVLWSGPTYSSKMVPPSQEEAEVVLLFCSRSSLASLTCLAEGGDICGDSRPVEVPQDLPCCTLVAKMG